MSEVKFEPFQKVLVRDCVNQVWSTAFFSHEQHSEDGLEYICGGIPWIYCIPYKGNEHLLGTTDSPTPPEPEFLWGDKVEVKDVGNDAPWLPAIFLNNSDEAYVVIRKGADCTSNWFHCRHADW